MSMPAPEKPCPFCGEQILAVAMKCRFCGEFVDGRPRVPASSGGGGSTAVIAVAVVLGVGVLLCLIVIVCLAAISLIGTSASSTFHMVGEQIEAAGNSVTDPIEGFTMNNPGQDWTLYDERMRNDPIKVRVRKGFGNDIECQVRVSPGRPVSLRNEVRRFLNGPDEASAETIQDTFFQGNEAIRISVLSPDRKMRTQALVIAHRGKMYQIILTGPADRVAESGRDYNACIDAFRFLD